MPLLVPLAALQKGTVRLSGELTPAELGLETLDPCVEARQPIEYDLEVQLMGEEVFVEGELATVFDCQCVKCLERFDQPFQLKPWACVLPLEGEDAAPVLNESVDLTPQIREDTLLGLPQHPVCRSNCQGLPLPRSNANERDVQPADTQRVPNAWSILDTLKLDR